jgi:hypothetical protein
MHLVVSISLMRRGFESHSCQSTIFFSCLSFFPCPYEQLDSKNFPWNGQDGRAVQGARFRLTESPKLISEMSSSFRVSKGAWVQIPLLSIHNLFIPFILYAVTLSRPANIYFRLGGYSRNSNRQGNGKVASYLLLPAR